MADDDQSKPDVDPPQDIDTPNAPPQGYPKPGDPSTQPSDSVSRQQAYIDELEKNYTESVNRSDKMFGQLQGDLSNLMQLANRPPISPPQLQTAPAVPTDQQKNNASEWTMNLLKFGALAALAFGAGGRGPGHNAIWKSAIGAALKGYAAGRKDVTDNAMKVWEKNREIINDANRQQLDRYKELRDNDKLSLEQKFSAFSHLSTLYGDYRTAQAARNKDLVELRKAHEDLERLQHDKEEWENKKRDHIYDVFGKNKITNKYLAWVNDKLKGKAVLTENSPADVWYKITKDYPNLSFSAFLKEQSEQEVEQAAKKAGGEEAARLKAQKEAGKEGGEGDSEEEQAKKEAARKKVDELKKKILRGL